MALAVLKNAKHESREGVSFSLSIPADDEFLLLHQLDFETGGTGAFGHDAFEPALSRLLQSMIAFIFEVFGVPELLSPAERGLVDDRRRCGKGERTQKWYPECVWLPPLWVLCRAPLFVVSRNLPVHHRSFGSQQIRDSVR